MSACPSAQKPMRASSSFSSCPAFFRIAPSTPPPGINPELAAFTIASTVSVVISASIASMRPAIPIRYSLFAISLSPLGPGADQMKRNRFPPRQADLVAFARNQAAHGCAIEPARGQDLVAVDGNVAHVRFREAADHQVERKRPGLGCEIAYAVHAHADLLEHFAPDRFLDRLARLDETRERR